MTATAPKANANELVSRAYPDPEVLPCSAYMSPCEVLCWIGYRRAITKELYFAPLKGGAGLCAEALKRRLHESIPTPRPPNDPMGGAEDELLSRLRLGQLRALIEDEHSLPPVDPDVFRNRPSSTH